jgi:hypothetical protein
MKTEYLVLDLVEVEEKGVKVFFPDGSEKVLPTLTDVLNFLSNEGWRLLGLHPKKFWLTRLKSPIPSPPSITGLEVIRYWLILERETAP